MEFFKPLSKQRGSMLNYLEKKTGDHARLGENDFLLPWRSELHRKSAMLEMCARS